MKSVTECAVCGKEVEVLDEFNGEMMCKDCYHEEGNHIFGDDING